MRRRTIALVVLIALSITLGACSKKTSSTDQSSNGASGASTQTATSDSTTGTASSSGVTTAPASAASASGECAACAGLGTAPIVVGTVTVIPDAQGTSTGGGSGGGMMGGGGQAAPTATVGGTQVASVLIKNGYYSPNVFYVISSLPVRVVFTGSATGCLANPTFQKLGKTVNFEKTGYGVIDLGKLAPGTYEFTCGMDTFGGRIVVQY